MSLRYYLRCGDFGEVIDAHGPKDLPRHVDVIVRTHRGIESGQVLRVADPDRTTSATILRQMTEDDRWLSNQLQKRRRQAVRECQAALRDAQFEGALLDIQQQFDGSRVTLHFMGSHEAGQAIIQPIVDQYEAIVRSSKLAERLIDGCGPNCGTSDSSCKGSCIGCAVADRCGENEGRPKLPNDGGQ